MIERRDNNGTKGQWTRGQYSSMAGGQEETITRGQEDKRTKGQEEKRKRGQYEDRRTVANKDMIFILMTNCPIMCKTYKSNKSIKK